MVLNNGSINNLDQTWYLPSIFHFMIRNQEPFGRNGGNIGHLPDDEPFGRH